MRTEYEILYESLKSSCGAEKVETVLNELKEVAVKNFLDYSTYCLHDFFRLTELTFNPKLDKYYGKH